MKKIIIGLLLCLPIATWAADSRSPEAKIFNRELNYEKSFTAFANLNENGGSIAVGDLGFDGKAEIVIGSGPGEEPWVYIFSSNGDLKKQFLAYDVNSKMGVNVAIGNVRGKKKGKKVRNEIIAAPMLGGGPQVRIFNQKGDALYNGSFFAFAEDFKGGVNIAACDMDGDKRDELIASAGPGGSPHIRAFNGFGSYIGVDYRPFSEEERGGATVACANVDGGKEEELVFAIQSFGRPQVKVYKTNSEQTILGDFLAYMEEYKGGVQITSGDFDKDGLDEIVTGTNSDGGPQVRIFEAYGAEVRPGIMAYEDDFRGGMRLAAGPLSYKKNYDYIVTLPSKRVIEGRADLFKYIDINLSEQRLQAYYNGRKVFDFLISSGKSGFATPTGEFAVYAKLHSLRMVGFYGEGNPNNYDLPNVPHVLAFYGDYTIHGAYWHHNWGHVMSHGCVNEPLDEAAWLYDWANVGDPVIVHY